MDWPRHPSRSLQCENCFTLDARRETQEGPPQDHVATDSGKRNHGDGEDLGRHQTYGKGPADAEGACCCPTCHLGVMYRSIPKPPIPPPPGQTPGHLTFLKNFGQIPRYVASLDGQMPHPLELQRGSNTPPSWHVTHEINEYKQNRLTLETNSAKFSATTNFLFSLSSLHTLNKGIFHDITI